MGTRDQDQDDISNDENVDENPGAVESEFLNMSDEDMQAQFASMASAPAAKTAAKAGDDAGNVEETDEDKAAQAAAIAALDDDNLDDDDENAEGKADAKADVVDGAPAPASAADKAAADKDGKAAPVLDAEGKEKVDAKVDAEAKAGAEGAKAGSESVDVAAEYAKIMAPFTANGKTIQAKSADDAIALMQMGANYNKKMAGLKPSLKLVKMLDAAGLTNEADLGFLIDLHKRDPGAINKLIVDSKMDPLDLSADKAGEYKPGNHAVDERAIELDEVLDEIKDSTSYAQTLQVVSTEWDQASRSEVVKAPQVIKLINDHIQSGVYAIIQAEMESERTFGRLKGLSDIQAYQKVGDAINARGGFDHLKPGSSQQKKETPPAAPVIVTPKPKASDEDKLKAARKAASGTKAAAPGTTGVPADFNPLALSDDDFAKFK